MSNQKTMFQKLTPTSEAKIGAYRDALDFVFQHDDVRNVGLTGALGAGKSSIMKSYEKQSGNNKKFIYVSLAHFEDADILNLQPVETTKQSAESSDNPRKTKESQSKRNDVAILEGKIINQLIHQVDVDSIPKTRFRIKRQNSGESLVGLTISVILFFLTLIYLIFFNNWAQIIEALDSDVLKSLLDFTARKSTLVLDITILIGLFSYGLYKLIWLLKDKQFIKKLNLNGNEIEIFSDCEESYFDKYLNDVLYIFEGCKVDAVVFEDIDRYKCVMIFQRLREINELVNRRLGQRKLIRFFYLMRDDIFTSKDRAKFFDFIIPIVPVVDNSNSYELLFSHFKEANCLDCFNEYFFNSISLYIDDMRILKNICNEFFIYLSSIRGLDPDYNKLFSLITYKNLFPRDFYLMQMNSGYVNYLISKKSEAIASILKQKKDVVARNKTLIAQIQNEHLQSNKELDYVYRALLAAPNVKTVPELNDEKAKRAEIIKLKANQEEKKLEETTHTLEEEIKQVESFTLADTASNYEKIFVITDEAQESRHTAILNSDYFNLVKYLVKNGYIDENYHDYITLFYPNSISFNDKTFLMRVLNLSAPSYNYELNNPRLVVERLDLRNISRASALNFHLLDFLQTDHVNNHNKFIAYINMLKGTNNVEFIAEYYQTREPQCTSELTSTLVNIWPEIASNIIKSNNISEDIKNKITLQFLLNTKKTFLQSLNYNNIFSDYIQKTLCMYPIRDEDVDQIIEAIDSMKIKVEIVDIRWTNRKLWGHIYSQDMYVLNLTNIYNILEYEYKVPPNEDWSHRTLMLIYSLNSEPLVQYVSNQLSSIFSVILDSCDSLITDDETTVIAILNNETIQTEEKLRYITYLKPCIKTIKSVKNIELWPQIILSKLLAIDPTNILAYYFLSGNGLDQHLIQSINISKEKFNLSYKDINRLYSNKAYSFFSAIVECNALSDSKYTEILTAINHFYPAFLIEKLSERKMNTLIVNKVIRCDKETLDNIRKNYSSNLSLFIVINIDAYSVLIQTIGVVDSELELILSMNSLNYKRRLSLLKLTKSMFQTIGKNYPESIEAYIVENNFDETELEYYIKNFSFLKNKTKSAFITILPEKVPEVLTQEFTMDFVLLKQILEDKRYDIAIKRELYSNSISGLLFSQNLICLRLLEENDFISIFYNKKPVFINNKYNNKVLQSFMNHGWIKRVTKQVDGSHKSNGCRKGYRIQ